MQWFNDLKISSKLIFGFGILTVLLVVLGLFSTWQLKQVNDKSAEISTNWLPSVTFTSDMNTNTSDFRIAELQHILSLTEEEMSSYEKNMAQVMNAFNKNDEAYQKLISSEQEKQLYNAFKSKWNEYLKEYDKIIALSRQNKNDEAKALIRGRSQQLFDEFSANLLQLVELNKKGGEDSSAASNELYNNSRTLIIGLLAIAIIVSISIGYIISNAIARPINEAVETAEKLSRGELPQSMKIKSRDEVGRLIESMNTMTDYLRNMARVADSIAKGNLTVEVQPQSLVDVFGNTFKTMLDSLRTIIRELRENSHTLSSAAGELVAVSTNQSAVITEQASSIQEISTTLDEIRATVEQASDRAKSVAHVSEQSLEISKTGQQELEQVVGAMSKIRDQVETIAENILDLSEKTIQIGEITSSVNDIAEQSNLLAVNAAIEATKAGEAGKGFGVVAVEVKNLAARSKKATTQVRSILAEIQKAANSTVMVTEEGSKKVENGVEQVYRIGNNIKNLHEVIVESATAAKQIAYASTQQVTGIEQITIAMKQINQGTNESVASARQQKATAQNLSDLATSLTNIVQRYQL